ncbi:hypothetical protein GUJ93_ZPchr0003g18166 [Zizania palustris]|uniref:Uncharacterized protein n=1 Tax=Zizania palustris TaxID=103762 RepID=A0A8J5VD99_ZIZPA|nr:hypothetical protein GUJ93_ZPchr0003g18166 [Zizania palustris]
MTCGYIKSALRCLWCFGACASRRYARGPQVVVPASGSRRLAGAVVPGRRVEAIVAYGQERLGRCRGLSLRAPDRTERRPCLGPVGWQPGMHRASVVGSGAVASGVDFRTWP